MRLAYKYGHSAHCKRCVAYDGWQPRSGDLIGATRIDTSNKQTTQVQFPNRERDLYYIKYTGICKCIPRLHLAVQIPLWSYAYTSYIMYIGKKCCILCNEVLICVIAWSRNLFLIFCLKLHLSLYKKFTPSLLSVVNFKSRYRLAQDWQQYKAHRHSIKPNEIKFAED